MKKLFATLAVSCCLSALYSQECHPDLPLNEKSFQITDHSPVRIIEMNNSHYFIDFGKAWFGSLVLRTESGQRESLVLHLGEKRSGQGSVCRNPGGTIRYQEVRMDGLPADEEIRVPLQADKRNTNERAIALPDSFGVIMPFQYCELEGLRIPIEELDIRLRSYHYRFNDHASSFASSDTILNRIWEMGKHTIKATSFAGYYVDGDRERIPYEADAFINQLSHYCVDSVYSLARRTNLYFLDNPTWPTEWILHVVPLFYYDYLYTGDTGPLRQHYHELKIRTLESLEGPGGLISSSSEELSPEFMLSLGFSNPDERLRDIVDWPPGQKDTGWPLATEEGERDGYEMLPVNTVVNAFYYWNLCLMHEIAAALGNTEDAACYEAKAAAVKKTFRKVLFDEVRGVFVDGAGSRHASLHANMFPLAFGLVDEDDKASVIQHIKSRGMACSVYGAQYLLEGLFNAGEAAYGLQLMTDTTGDRNWWNMIESGSSMTMEAWDIRYKPNLDWNHAWGSAPVNIVSRQLWGIRPAVPGFTRAIIAPQLAGLTSSKIQVPTRLGIIKASMRQENNKTSFILEVPENMTADFILPEGSRLLELNGSMNAPSEVLHLGSGQSRILLQRQ